MRKIAYGSGEFTTSDDIAAGVLRYAAFLANAGRAATLTVPVFGLGHDAEIEVLVGPASQLTSEPVDGDEEIAGQAEFLAELQRRMDPPRTTATETMDWDFDV